MNVIKKCASGALALMLAAGIAGGALAAETADGDVDVEIIPMAEGGVLSVSITSLNLGQLEYSLTPQHAGGHIDIHASDLRGNADGWYVVLSGTDFDAADDEFAVDNLDLSNGVVTTIDPSGHATNAAPQQAVTPATLADNGTQVLTAAPRVGAGKYKLTYEADLNIPAGTLVGEYQSTLTVTITGFAP